MLGIVIACRESVHSIKAAYTSSCDSCLCTTTNDDISLAQANEVESISKSVC